MPFPRLRILFRSVLLLGFFVLGLFSVIELSNLRAKSTFEEPKVVQSWRYHDRYCVISDYWRSASHLHTDDHITLVLHATPGYLDFVTQQAASWDGPISVAVFIPTPRHPRPIAVGAANNSVVLDSVQLHLQSIFAVADSLHAAQASGKVALHFFFERQNFTQCPSLQLVPLALRAHVSDLGDFAPSAELYPINAARNIARKLAHTRLFISGDIEQLFVPSAEPRMAQLAKRVLLEERREVVLVHRRFEIEPSAPAPKTKADIAALLKAKRAIQFHDQVYPIGHRIAGLQAWLVSPEDAHHTAIFRTINYTNAEWEPQFVGDERVPMHDERFPFRLRSNTHMGTLLCYRGFRFAVMEDVFTFHRGIKRKEGGVEAHLKKLSIHKGYHAMVKQFRDELSRQFPAMHERCPLFLP